MCFQKCQWRNPMLIMIFDATTGLARANQGHPRDSVKLKVPILATVRSPLCNTLLPPTPSPPIPRPSFRCAAVARVAFWIIIFSDRIETRGNSGGSSLQISIPLLRSGAPIRGVASTRSAAGSNRCGQWGHDWDLKNTRLFINS